MERKAILQPGIKVKLRAKNTARIVVGYDNAGGEIKKSISAESGGEILATVGKNKYKVRFYTGGNPGIVDGISVLRSKSTVPLIQSLQVLHLPAQAPAQALD